MPPRAARRPRRAANRLAELREARGLSMAALADCAGTTASTINKLEKGDRKLSPDWLAQLAKCLEVSRAEILGDSMPPSEIPLWGYAGAGEIVHHIDGDAPAETVEAPPGMKDGAAVIVRGDSMLPRWADGDMLFFEMRARSPEDLLNRECLVRLKSGSHLVKRLTRGTRRGRYHLVSVNPAVRVMEDQQVEWAAAILWTRHTQQG